MLNAIKQWLSSEPQNTSDDISVELASAALLVEVMAADHQWEQAEEDSIINLLQTTLHLDKEQAIALVKDAKQHHTEANDLYKITKKINDTYSPDQKYELVLNLWKVAFIDGNLDRYEDYMIRKIAELIYLPHSQFIRAKLEADPNQPN